MPPDREYGTKLRLLRILRALIDHPFGYTKRQLADSYSVSPDTIKSDFITIKNAGFILAYDSQYRYALKENKPYKQLKDLLHFNEDEQFLLSQAIDQIAEHTPTGERLKRKLGSLYNYQQLGHAYLRKPYLGKLDALLEAKEKKKKVVLKNYRSSNSNQVSDRLVEPFHPSPPDDVLHAFDTVQKAIRHFRISRFDRVELTDQDWEYTSRHHVASTDPFRILDDQKVMVHLRMKVGGYNALVEQFPRTKAFIEPAEEKDVFDFQCEVNHRFLGITPFVLGHYKQIVAVAEPESLIQHLNALATAMKF